MTIAFAIVALALVVLLAYREWGFICERDSLRSERDSLRTAAATEIARCRAETAAERDRAATERRELYQRIQAPEIAVHDAQLEARRERPYVPRKPIGADDDKAFAARNGKDDRA